MKKHPIFRNYDEERYSNIIIFLYQKMSKSLYFEMIILQNYNILIFPYEKMKK